MGRRLILPSPDPAQPAGPGALGQRGPGPLQTTVLAPQPYGVLWVGSCVQGHEVKTRSSGMRIAALRSR